MGRSPLILSGNILRVEEMEFTELCDQISCKIQVFIFSLFVSIFLT